jgi:hypothetical protein
MDQKMIKQANELTVVPPTAKARKSVNEVTVIATPDRFNTLPNISSSSSRLWFGRSSDFSSLFVKARSSSSSIFFGFSFS